MKKIISTLLLFFPLLIAFAFPVDSQITSAINKELPCASVGVIIANAKTGTILYQKEANQYFTPASNAKLLTAAAALYGLGPNFTFNTRVEINSKQLYHNTLNGNLYIQFTGDPSFRTQNLLALLQEIKEQGIHKINGNIVIDDSTYEKPYHGFGWAMDDLSWSFAAPIHSIMIDENTANIQIDGKGKLGQKPLITQRNNKAAFQIINQLMLVTPEKTDTDCDANFQVDSQNNIHITGCWAQNRTAYEQLAIYNPFLYVKEIIEQQKPFILQGHILIGTVPENLTSIASYQSAPLSKLVIHMMKESDNLYANSFLKMLGKKYYNQGTFKLGIKAEKKILADKTNMDVKKIAIYDGSGQTRYALITPYQFYQLLFAVYHDPEIKRFFIASLPITGIDGTLKNWKDPKNIIGKVHAKTGTMMGISTLSGFIRTKDQNDLIFSILINHVQGRLGPAHRLEREILKLLTI